MLKTINTSLRTYELIVNPDDKLEAVKHELVDYLRDALLLRDGYSIPCTIGYLEDESDNTIYPSHIFINNGCTDEGYCYYEETINLL